MFDPRLPELTEAGMSELSSLFLQRENLIKVQCVVQAEKMNKLDFAVPPGCDDFPEVQKIRMLNQKISNMVC